MEGILFIISAPSGAGKTSLVKELVKRVDKLGLSISCTTRQKRVGEENGVHYYFLERSAFEQAISEQVFLEYAEVFGNLYGTRRDDVRAALEKGQDILLEIDWQGAQQVRRDFPDAVSIFILPPSLEILEQRLRNRATDSEEIISVRLEMAETEISHRCEYDYQLVNDNFDEALRALMAIVVAERLRTSRCYRDFALK